MLFLDASALMKAYLTEDGTRAVQAAMKRMNGSLVVSDLVALEVLNVIRRKFNKGSLSEPEYRRARLAFAGDYPGAFRVAPVGPDALRRAFSIADSHRQKSVGGVDVLHLATALYVSDGLPAGFQLTFATADLDLKDLATQKGLRTFDPTADRVSTIPRRGGAST